MAKVTIFDNSFVYLSKSASIGGDNLGVGPTHFEWTTEDIDGPRFFTDARIKDVTQFGPSPRNIAWILEPHCLRPDPYEDAREYEKFFGMILSHDIRQTLHPKHNNVWKYYAYGGSWISFENWGIHKKSREVSLIASEKNTTEGHQLRHEVAKKFKDVDLFGYAYRPVVSKTSALIPYRYSVVIESCRQSSYFTEKLIDCISVGTVPIYWGCPTITRRYFDGRGMIIFNHIDDLEYILTEQISERDYRTRLPFIKKNIKHAKKYRICEDYIWKKYPEIFE